MTHIAALPAIAGSPRTDPVADLTRAYQRVLDVFGALGHPVASDENYAGTAARAARGMLDLVRPTAEIEEQVRAMLGCTFPATYQDMVISKHNACFGLCPHHLLPVSYRISLAYVPDSRVLGISKLSRLARLMARRPVLQEDLTHELALVLHERLESKGSAVLVEGLHLCMAARGAEAHEARVTTSAVRGLFQTDRATRQEFLDLVSRAQPPLL
jgi:GTP cyclohydrolase IA